MREVTSIQIGCEANSAVGGAHKVNTLMRSAEAKHRV